MQKRKKIGGFYFSNEDTIERQKHKLRWRRNKMIKKFKRKITFKKDENEN